MRPGLFVRCNFCNIALPLNQLCREAVKGREAAAPRLGEGFLSRQNPVLSCCPSCRRELPKCYVCLLPLSGINPYTELKRHQTPNAHNSLPGAEDMSTLHFAEWFTWCQRCKHGYVERGVGVSQGPKIFSQPARSPHPGTKTRGHASHISEWFERHEICGVSGCGCRCAEL